MDAQAQVAQQPARRSLFRERIAWFVAALWLGGAGGALGYFVFEDRRAFESTTLTLFDVQNRAQAAEEWFRSELGALEHNAARATVVTVLRPGCSCNRFTIAHVAELSERYAHLRVRFIEIQPPSELPWLDAAPAALVFDADDLLAYFGPFSSVAWCGRDGGLVEPVLDQLLRGARPRPQPFYDTGCFCGSAAV